MRFIFDRQIMTPPPTGRVPPARLVPAPRGTNGTSSSLHSLTTAATCSAEFGKTTTDGGLRRGGHHPAGAEDATEAVDERCGGRGRHGFTRRELLPLEYRPPAGQG